MGEITIRQAQVPASDGSAYREYALTQKVRELFPVIVVLRQWGESHLFSRGEKRLQVLDKRTGKPFLLPTSPVTTFMRS
jgi:DNA-binding HxlR family transcriptional regulator